MFFVFRVLRLHFISFLFIYYVLSFSKEIQFTCLRQCAHVVVLLCCRKDRKGTEWRTAGASRPNAEERKKKKQSGSRFDDEGQSNQMILFKCAHVTCTPGKRDGEGWPPRRLDIVSAVFHRGRNEYNPPCSPSPCFLACWARLSPSDEWRPGSSVPPASPAAQSQRFIVLCISRPRGSDVPLQ